MCQLEVISILGARCFFLHFLYRKLAFVWEVRQSRRKFGTTNIYHMPYYNYLDDLMCGYSIKMF